MIDLSSQAKIVVKQLVLYNNMTVQAAFTVWNRSQTKRYLEKNKLDYVSGMRCYWELCLELNKDRRWLKEPFDM